MLEWPVATVANPCIKQRLVIMLPPFSRRADTASPKSLVPNDDIRGGGSIPLHFTTPGQLKCH